MATTFPHTVSVSQMQSNYKIIFDKIKTGPCFILRNNTPEAVIVKTEEYKMLNTLKEKYEMEEAQKAIRNYKSEKKHGKLKVLKNLQDLM
jgi:PHD/YefM family antitoxin component YafN of YafNO toxin-antitoxin module